MNHAFDNLIETKVESPAIREMMRYAIDGGKRLRPILFLCMIPDKNPRDYFDVCLGLELMHTCSLVLDDLPCMDDDKERRGRPAFHIQFGEVRAKLFVSYCMYFSMKLIREKQLDKNCMRLIANMVYRNMGACGACTGQFLDLCPIMPHTNKKEFIEQYSSKEGLQELLNLKTTTFFQLGFQGGYILNLDSRKSTDSQLDYFENDPIRKKIEEMTNDFGFAFQLFDDFDDIQQDYERKRDGEFTPNFILTYGLDASKNLYEHHMNQFIETYTDIICGDTSHICYQLVSEIREYLTSNVYKRYDEITPELKARLNSF